MEVLFEFEKLALEENSSKIADLIARGGNLHDLAQPYISYMQTSAFIVSNVKCLAEDDPILLELRQMMECVTSMFAQLTLDIKEGLLDLKMYIDELEYQTNIIDPFCVLTAYQNDFIQHPDKVKRDELLQKYEYNDPRSLLIKIRNRLSGSTNQVTRILESTNYGDPMYKKYRNAVVVLAVQLGALDAFCYSLKMDSSIEHLRIRGQIIADEQSSIKVLLDGFDSQMKSEYWPKPLTAVVKEIVEKNSNKTDETMANMAMKKLRENYPWSQFIVIVHQAAQTVFNLGCDAPVEDTLRFRNFKDKDVVIFRTSGATSPEFLESLEQIKKNAQELCNLLESGRLIMKSIGFNIFSQPTDYTKKNISRLLDCDCLDHVHLDCICTNIKDWFTKKYHTCRFAYLLRLRNRFLETQSIAGVSLSEDGFAGHTDSYSVSSTLGWAPTYYLVLGF